MQENKVIISQITNTIKYSSINIKKGLNLANALLLSNKKYLCTYVECGKPTKVNLDFVSTNEKETKTIWGDKKDIAITSSGNIVASVDN